MQEQVELEISEIVFGNVFWTKPFLNVEVHECFWDRLQKKLKKKEVYES